MGVVPPADGYLAGLRAACDRTGALLILDEVITGFRIARGGAQERYGVRRRHHLLRQDHRRRPARRAPSAAARDVMRELAPEGPCYQAGTLSGNPLATAAGPRRAGRARAPRASTSGSRSRGAALEEALRASGAPVTINRVGSMLTPFFTEGPVARLRRRHRSDTAAYGALRPRAAGRGRLPAALAVRGLVHRPHPRRRRAGPRRARRFGPGGRRVRAVLADEPTLGGELVEPAAAPLLAPLVAPPLTAEQAAGLDLILEGFLLHHGRPRHLAPAAPGRGCWPATTATPTAWCGSPPPATCSWSRPWPT